MRFSILISLSTQPAIHPSTRCKPKSQRVAETIKDGKVAEEVDADDDGMQ